MRKSPTPASVELSGGLASLGLNLLEQGQWLAAEAPLRECLDIRKAPLPNDWTRFNTMSTLGGSLLGQGRFAEAEPLVISGYDGMKAREATIPRRARSRLTEAALRCGPTLRFVGQTRTGRGAQEGAWAGRYSGRCLRPSVTPLRDLRGVSSLFCKRCQFIIVK